MSGKGRSGRRNVRKNAITDVTIDDFANSTICSNRLKKSMNSANKLEVDERSWDEKSIWEYDETEENGIKISRKRYVVKHNNHNRFADYPIDVWYLISKHIRPEDVGRFALICKKTHLVTLSANFWFRIYRKYYRLVDFIPKKLQPEHLTMRIYGLRSLVIKTLFYTYPRFIQRSKSLVRLKEHPNDLLKMRCVTTWACKTKQTWIYNFKMKVPDLSHFPSSDVCSNSEIGHRILQVTSKNFVSIPPLMGMTLYNVNLSCAVDLKLNLKFCAAATFTSISKYSSSCTDLVISAISNIKILDWWDPEYPHSNVINIPKLLDNDLDLQF